MDTGTPATLLAQVRAPSFDESVSQPRFDQFDTFEQVAPTATEPSAFNPWNIPFYDAWLPFAGIALVVVLIFCVGIIYNFIRLRQVRAKEKAEFAAEPPGLAMSMFLEGQEHGEAHRRGTPEESRWRQVLEHIRSDNQNDWRLAIIEADIMLNDLATTNGYAGETLADKLKQVDRNRWNSIDMAWEAHKARNKIAHEGTAHELTQREARRIIGLFEQVFKEFNYIPK